MIQPGNLDVDYDAGQAGPVVVQRITTARLEPSRTEEVRVCREHFKCSQYVISVGINKQPPSALLLSLSMVSRASQPVVLAESAYGVLCVLRIQRVHTINSVLHLPAQAFR